MFKMIKVVILSAACSSRSEKQAKSKDPYNSTDTRRDSQKSSGSPLKPCFGLSGESRKKLRCSRADCASTNGRWKNGNKDKRSRILRQSPWCCWCAGAPTRWHAWTKSRREGLASCCAIWPNPVVVHFAKSLATKATKGTKELSEAKSLRDPSCPWWFRISSAPS